jgi:hypothetical protein
MQKVYFVPRLNSDIEIDTTGAGVVIEALLQCSENQATKFLAKEPYECASFELVQWWNKVLYGFGYLLVSNPYSYELKEDNN